MNYKIYSEYDPIANSESIVCGKNYRFTILTSRLIRVEYSESGTFNDNQTQVVLNRNFPTPDFEIFEDNNSLVIQTENVLISYDKKPFSRNGLIFKLRGNYSAYHSDWHFGDEINDLKGTARTLDHANGKVELERGIISRFGFSVLADNKSLLLDKDGWYRVNDFNNEDFYFFGYGHNYLDCLNDFYKLTGSQPLLPRYAFGNWWSRFYKYTENSYMELINRFENEGIPFTVAVIDMDWHEVDIPEKYGSGWTGYTWNKKLFPNPERFLQWLHGKGYKVTVNVHPADGVRPHESMYREMAEELGVDWENEQFIIFDPTSKRFMDAYFKYIHNPNEDIGVDFWWLDWQQGESIKGIDPLWVLNHYHYHDNEFRNDKGLTFSRYAGPGSHRYPVGFSGDTHITWESLKFQPYFTANASNIGYGWWSHDIGGHMFGYRDNELFTRWVQLGVFSPIMRLHSSSSEFLTKEPWNYPEPYKSILVRYLRLRHQMIPYLYSMNYRASNQNIPLVLPMYYHHPNQDEAYNVPNQYYFGSELIVMPITEKVDTFSNYAKFEAWLPEGTWYDFNTGIRYDGNRKILIYRDLESMGIFAKSGAIVPFSSESDLSNQIENPYELLLNIFSGSDGQFTLFEDNEKSVFETKITYCEKEQKLNIQSNTNKHRKYIIRVFGLEIVQCKDSTENDMELNYQESFTELSFEAFGEVKLSFMGVEKNYSLVIKKKLFDYINQAQIEYSVKEKLWTIINRDNRTVNLLMELNTLNLDEPIIGPIKELLSLRADKESATQLILGNNF